jgi:DNA-binding transcriptional regulator YiaG
MIETRMIEKCTLKIFGFDVLLKNVPEMKIGGEWCYDIDMEELRTEVLLYLLTSKNRLSGNHLKFIRKGMSMTLEQFGQKTGVTRQSVMSWEAKGDLLTEMALPTEVSVRANAYMAAFDNKTFISYYKLLSGIDPNKNAEKVKAQTIKLEMPAVRSAEGKRQLELH